MEYNPFHNGHLFHLHAAKEITNANVIIAVMSGSFLQRGEPAALSKWARTEMALENGIDLVIELPYIFSTQKAEIFATSAVSILSKIGVTRICFGSESGEINEFLNTVSEVMEKETKINMTLKKYVKKGLSYPKAFAKAFQENVDTTKTLDLSKPNNILGYHYVRAIQRLNLRMEAYTIKREKSHYHDDFFQQNEEIASATAIRKNLLETNCNLRSIENYVPSATKQIMEKEIARYGSIPHWEDYFPFLQHKILTANIEDLQQIYDCDEGLEYRLKKMIVKVNTFQQYMEMLKTKRYTWTRLQRLLVHVLMNTTKSFMEKYCNPTSPPYLRILGMSEKGREYLSLQKKKLDIPIISRASEVNHPVLQKDILASHIHTLPFVKKVSLHEEYEAIPIILNRK